MNTYDWSITRMICNSQQNNESNVVIRVRWRCTGSDGTHSVTRSEFCNITYDPNDTFIEYSNLTESEVLTWVWNTVNKVTIESNIDQMLSSMNNPPQVVLDLPWSSTQV